MLLPFLSEPLPPSIPWLLSHKVQVRKRYPSQFIGHRKWRVSALSLPFNPVDTPSASFYRLYQFVATGWTLQMRNELEYFCSAHPDWAVADLPDPGARGDPARYALLAGVTHLMCEAFNARVELGLPRDAPAIVQDWEELAARPKVWERVPAWAERVPPLGEMLRIPDERGKYVEADDADVCVPLKRYNIVMVYPHIHFI